MSGTVRAGIVFGLASVVAFVGGLLLGPILPCVNLIVALGSVIVLGWGAGYTAAKTTGAGPGQGAGRGATAGAIAGVISLIGLTIALLVLFNIPAVRAQIELAYQQALQQNPELAGAGLDPATLGIATGVFLGMFCGGTNFILMLIGGLIGGMMWKGAPRAATADYGPSGGTPGGYGPSSGPYTPPSDYGGTQGGSSRPYGPDDPNRPSSGEDNVRIYDSEDRDRR